jgi:hypothetical protein
MKMSKILLKHLEMVDEHFIYERTSDLSKAWFLPTGRPAGPKARESNACGFLEDLLFTFST